MASPPFRASSRSASSSSQSASPTRMDRSGSAMNARWSDSLFHVHFGNRAAGQQTPASDNFDPRPARESRLSRARILGQKTYAIVVSGNSDFRPCSSVARSSETIVFDQPGGLLFLAPDTLHLTPIFSQCGLGRPRTTRNVSRAIRSSSLVGITMTRTRLPSVEISLSFPTTAALRVTSI